MSEPLILIYETTVHEGQFEAFMEVSKKLVADTQKEKGAQVYEWYVSEDKRLVHVVERYASSEAILEHLGTFTRHVDEMMKVSTPVRLQICGNPTQELKAALEGQGVLYLTPFGGFRK